jgi:hypothetical protein
MGGRLILFLLLNSFPSPPTLLPFVKKKRIKTVDLSVHLTLASPQQQLDSTPSNN